MDLPADEPSAHELGSRVGRYDEAGPLGKAAMRLSGAAPTAQERELLRRKHIGIEGRIAEDVARIVLESEPIWTLLTEKDLPEDLTVQELDAISEWLRGRPAEAEAGSTALPVSASLKFSNPGSVAAVTAAIPGDFSADDVTAYRYALFHPRANTVEPFVVALYSEDRTLGPNEIVATMLVAGTFLRHEQEFGVVSAADLDRLHRAVELDLQETIRTRQLLREA